MNKTKATHMYDAKADRLAALARSERDGCLQIMWRDGQHANRVKADRLREAAPKGGAR
ncbi:MAG: hypothetical protein QOH97_4884 [Actinoplanes sp.]|jgi:hypothetical protein|nr:hypothetical protein [Actinoplanes sp.]